MTQHMSVADFRRAQWLAISEEEFTSWVVDLARTHGYLVHHDLTGRTASGWRTSVQGDTGFPDIVAVRAGRPMIVAELKSAKGRLTPEQKAWLAAFTGVDAEVWKPGHMVHRFGLIVACWTPNDRDTIEEEMS